MAIVLLKDVEVVRLNNTGHGVQVAEKYQVGGKDRQTRFMLWFKEPHGLQVGDVVSVSGFLGAKVGDPWQGQDGQERRSVELSVNSPRIDAGDAQRGGSGGSSTPAAGVGSSDGWNTPENGFDSEPF